MHLSAECKCNVHDWIQNGLFGKRLKKCLYGFAVASAHAWYVKLLCVRAVAAQAAAISKVANLADSQRKHYSGKCATFGVFPAFLSFVPLFRIRCSFVALLRQCNMRQIHDMLYNKQNACKRHLTNCTIKMCHGRLVAQKLYNKKGVTGASPLIDYTTNICHGRLAAHKLYNKHLSRAPRCSCLITIMTAV